MRYCIAAVLAPAIWLGAVNLLQAQQKAQPPDAGTISATTELVLVPAQVRGHDGKPLLGLKAEDFVLRCDGKPQPIRIFEPPVPVSAQPALAAAKGSPPNMFSSVPSSGMPEQILILAFDLVNTKFLDQNRARQDLIKYLETIPPNQRFALVAITQNGLAQVHNVASDPAVLLEALKKLQGSTSKDVSLPAPPDAFNSTQFATRLDPIVEYWLVSSTFSQEQIYGAYAEKIAARATLTALMQIAQAYAGVPGRKSVIWMTGGMPLFVLDPSAGGLNGRSSLNADPELIPDYERAFAALNNANIAIYGVDVKGTRVNQRRPRQENGFYHNGAIGLGRNARISGIPMISSDDPGDDAIKVLSAATGGKACTANGGLKDCIDEAVADSSNYYTLGFYVPQDNRKPGWHKLELKLVSANASVRARNAYYLASRLTPSDSEIGRTLRDTAYAKIGYTGVGFTVERKPANSPSQPIMRILVPASSVLLSPGHPQLSYDIVTVPLTPSGEPASDLRVIHLNLNEQQTQMALTNGWSFSDPVQGAGSQAVKYILRDNGTGRIGSVVVPGEPPAKGS